MLIEMYTGSIVTKEAARNIGVLFKQEIKGAWVKFSDYPETQVNLLFEHFIKVGYTYTCSEEELKVAFTEHIFKKIADWMWNLRRPIFQKYKSTGQRYANCLENVPNPTVWITMVDEWLKPKWQDQSKRNKANREKSIIVHTIVSVPMAK